MKPAQTVDAALSELRAALQRENIERVNAALSNGVVIRQSAVYGEFKPSSTAATMYGAGGGGGALSTANGARDPLILPKSRRARADKGHKRSPAVRARMAAAQQKRWAKRRKAVK